MSPKEVLTRDLSSGRIHRRLVGESGKLYTLEQDNLDTAGEYEVVTAEALEKAEPGELCLNCFPDIPDTPGDEALTA